VIIDGAIAITNQHATDGFQTRKSFLGPSGKLSVNLRPRIGAWESFIPAKANMERVSINMTVNGGSA